MHKLAVTTEHRTSATALLETGGFWHAVVRLLDRTDERAALTHKLGPLAAYRLRSRDQPVPLTLEAQERRAALSMLVVPTVLQRIRAACDGPIVLIKGPEVARLYPGEARLFADIDLLVPDAESVHRSLIGAGFIEVGDPQLYRGIHHLRPVESPGLSLRVEVHMHPKWPEKMSPPQLDEIFEAAVPCGLGVEGISVPAPAHHALILSAHAWAHEPLHTIRDLVDVSAVAGCAAESELGRVARAWGIHRIWDATRAASDAVLFEGSSPLPLLVWARHLRALRERTVLENHLQVWLHGYWQAPPTAALRMTAAALLSDLRPAFDEGWRSKLTRVAQAVGRAATPLSTHNERLGRAATRGRRRNPPSEER